MCSFHHIIQISTLVLQRSIFVLTPQEIEESVEESNVIDYRSILYVTDLGN